MIIKKYPDKRVLVISAFSHTIRFTPGRFRNWRYKMRRSFCLPWLLVTWD